MSLTLKQFITKNKQLWKEFQQDHCQGNLLVEAPGGINFIDHCMCMQTLIIHAGKKLAPLFIDSHNYNAKLVQSYVKNSKSIKLVPKLPLFTKLYAGVCVFFQIILMFIRGNVLALKFNGIKYGDIVYDSYLRSYSVGSLNSRDWDTFKKIVQIYLNLTAYHLRIKMAIHLNNVDAVLVSHKVNIQGGVLARCASKMGLVVYSNSGIALNSLCANRHFKNIKYYEYEPNMEDLENIKKLPNFKELFAEIQKIHFEGGLTMDAKNAYNKSNILYADREKFSHDFHADSKKKNVFVMLHAFTDFPHAHFDKMLFEDYAHWFLKTLEYAKSNDAVNWFFKRHPSDLNYPTNDIKFNEIFADSPSHIHFLDIKDKIDTRSLGAVADAIITCTGSAGFEMAAFFGIPCICGGNSRYSKFCFTKTPQNQKTYFEMLGKLNLMQKLTEEQQDTAKAFYMFTYKYARVPYSFTIQPTFKDRINDNNKTYSYYKNIADLYDIVEKKIKGQIATYAYRVSRNDFFIMRNEDYIPYKDYFSFPFSLQEKLPSHAPEILQEGCEALNKSQVKYCLMNGTLLGLYRDKQLIAHDRNLDVAVLEYEDLNTILFNFFVAGFSIGRYAIRYGKPQQIVFYKDKVVFDIIFYKQHGEDIYSFGEKDLYFKHDLKHFTNLQHLDFKGFSYPIPFNTERWLASTYGNNWKIPKKEKPNNWRDNDGTEYMAAYPFTNDPLAIIPFNFFISNR